MHPEETLNLEEAIGIFGIVHSVMGGMLKEIPARAPIANAFLGVLQNPP
jgi:hypothetical protein